MRRINNFSKRWKKALKDKERKSMLSILLEYVWLRLFNPSLSQQYFNKYLFRKNAKNLKNYLVTHQLHSDLWDINSQNSRLYPLLTDKLFFEKFFSGHKINVIKNLACNNGSMFIKEGNAKEIHTPEEFRNFLLSLKKENAVPGSLIIKKRKDSRGGKNIFKINLVDVNSDDTAFQKIYKSVTSSGFVYQDVIRQHHYLNKLNSFCINSIRVITYTNAAGEVKILSSFLRTGLDTHYVDNVSSGGGFVGIDLDNGTFNTELYTDFENGCGSVFKNHPLTNVKIMGFAIPFFNEAKELAMAAAKIIPQMTLIGWDIAIQADGPAIIEGNKSPGMISPEILEKGLKKNRVFMDLLNEMQGK